MNETDPQAPSDALPSNSFRFSRRLLLTAAAAAGLASTVTVSTAEAAPSAPECLADLGVH